MTPLDAADIKARTDLVELVRRYVPDLKQRGDDWWACCPFHGEKTPSFKVSSEFWKCFGGCGLGGDCYSFIENIEHCDFPTALKKLAEFAGVTNGNGNGNGNGTHAPKVELIRKRDQKPNDNNDPAPDDAPPCRFLHPKFGKPVEAWEYRDAEGRILGYDARYEEDGKKSVLPWRFMDGKWQMRGFSAPSPLYGLDDLTAKPGAIVVMVEGCKATGGARKFLHGKAVVVVSWQGGCNAVSKVDLTPLYGRTVILWPDADSEAKKLAGQKAMLYFGNKLFHACPKVTYIDPNAPLLPCPECGKIPSPDCPACAGKGVVKNLEPMPDGWDAADAAAEGWDIERWRAWVTPRAKDIGTLLETKAIEEEEERQEDTKNKALEGKLASAPAAHQRLWIEWDLARNGHSGQPYANMDNVCRILDKQHPGGFVYYDQFLQKIWCIPENREWADQDEVRTMCDIQRYMGLNKISRESVAQAVNYLAFKDVRHSVRDWMKSLVWDGVPRLESMLPDFFGTANNGYTQAVGRAFMVSLVARAFSPGCKADHMIVLEGVQGSRKSSALEELIGSKWYADIGEEVLSKDFMQGIQGKLCIEIGEMGSFDRADREAVKQMLSRRSDRYRQSYGRYPADYPRQCVFAGTTNKDNWNRDETGARRFWPVRCREIDIQGIKDAREQLFAEAVAIYLSVPENANERERMAAKADWWVTPIEDTRKEQESRFDEDPWNDRIAAYTTGLGEVTIAEILGEDVLKIETGRQGPGEQRRVGAILRHLGWTKDQKAAGKSTRKIWRPRETEYDL